MPVAPEQDRPLGDEEVDRLFAPLSSFGKVALAVSGGVDSFALLHLFRQWSRRHAGAPDAIVLTVDHGLRPEAADEAAKVAERCKAMGFEHRTLCWQGEKPTSGIQKAARDARFQLMREAMSVEGAEALLLAHHRDDQAETFLDRLARGSGPYGLAAMAKVSERDGITLHRLLLDVSKARLVASMKAAGLDWCEDPSNDDERYRRVGMRKLLPLLDEAGLGAERLAGTARAMRRAADALDAWVDNLVQTHVEQHAVGPCRVPVSALDGLPEEIALRLFARLLRDCGGSDYVPRLSSLETAVSELLSGSVRTDKAAIKRTLGHCVIELHDGSVLISREFGRQPPRAIELVPGQRAVWDRRFEFSLESAAPEPIRIEALGAGGLRRAGVDPAAGWPRSVFETAPAVLVHGELVALPGFDFNQSADWQKKLRMRRIAANCAGNAL